MRLRTFIPAAAAVALCFSACSNDDNNVSGPDPKVDEGAEASLMLSFGNPETTVTRAPDATYATADEVNFATGTFSFTQRTLSRSMFG